MSCPRLNIRSERNSFPSATHGQTLFAPDIAATGNTGEMGKGRERKQEAGVKLMSRERASQIEWKQQQQPQRSFQFPNLQSDLSPSKRVRAAPISRAAVDGRKAARLSSTIELSGDVRRHGQSARCERFPLATHVLRRTGTSSGRNYSAIRLFTPRNRATPVVRTPLDSHRDSTD